MANLTQADIDEIDISMDINGTKNNVEIREALQKVLLDVSNSSSAKILRANISQTGTSAPTMTILDNTLGGVPVWSYSAIGEYILTLSGAFGAADTALFSLTGMSQDGNYETSYFYWNDTNSITLDVLDDTGAPVNDYLVNTPIEIRVY